MGAETSRASGDEILTNSHGTDRNFSCPVCPILVTPAKTMPAAPSDQFRSTG